MESNLVYGLARKEKIFEYFLIAGIDKEEVNNKKSLKEINEISPKVLTFYCNHYVNCVKNNIVDFLNNL